MDDVWSGPGNIYYRRQFGEIDDPKKAVGEPWRVTKIVETVMKSILFFILALLPMVMSYVPPPESVLRMKELMAEWCTPSICFVFLVVGFIVATSGVLNGAQSRGLHDRGDVYQRHVTVVQREGLRMPDIFSVGENIRPLSIPTPAPVPFPVRDFPAVRPLPFYLKRDVSSRFENELRGLGKSASTPSPRTENLIPAKLSATQSMDRESYFARPHEPVMMNSSSFQIPVMSSSNSFRDRLAARRAPVAAPVFENGYPTSLAPASMTTSATAVPLEIPASPSPRPTSARSFEGPRSPAPTSTHVIDHDLLASPTVPHSDVGTLLPSSPSLAPTFVQELHFISTMRPRTPSTRPATPSTRPSTPAPRTPPAASPMAVHESVVIPTPLALHSPPDFPVDDGPGSPVPESPVDSPPATPTASPPPPPPDSPPATPLAPPPPPPLPTTSARVALDATVIAPVEVNLSPIVTRKPHSVRTSRSLNQSSARKPPSHPDMLRNGEPMSVPAKGSTSAAQKYEGESYLAMKAAGNQPQKGELTPGKVTNSMPSATGSPSFEGSAVEETDSKPAEDDVNQRVEAFLANFREQMRLQRQESLQRHHRGEE